MHSQKITNCQSCGSDSLKPLLFLGYSPPVNTLEPIGAMLSELPQFPIQMVRCEHCKLVQLSCAVDKEILFPLDYPFLSGITKTLRDNFAELAATSVRYAGEGKTNLKVLDVGSNDGTLLKAYRDLGCQVLGVEPTDTAQVAAKENIQTIRQYFNSQTAQAIAKDHGSFDVIAITNTLAHAENLNGVLSSIRQLLADKGTLVIEVHSLRSMLEKTQFDKITHEHQRYFTLQTLKSALQRHELEITFAEMIVTHGGGIRVFASHAGQRKADAKVEQLLKEEAQFFEQPNVFTQFEKRILDIKLGMQKLVADIKKQGGRLYGIGAPSRAFFLLAFAGIDHNLMECVLEVKNSLKLNKYIPGTMIPIVDEEKLYTDQPEYAMMLSWHVAAEVLPKLRARGYKGRFVVPLPEPKLLDI